MDRILVQHRGSRAVPNVGILCPTTTAANLTLNGPGNIDGIIATTHTGNVEHLAPTLERVGVFSIIAGMTKNLKGNS